MGIGRLADARGCVPPEASPTVASAFQPAQDALQTAAASRALADKAMGAPRVVVRFAEMTLEKVIREISLLAHVADNNATTGPAFKALFPNGLEAELSPLGAAQIEAATSLRKRLDTQPAATTMSSLAMICTLTVERIAPMSLS